MRLRQIGINLQCPKRISPRSRISNIGVDGTVVARHGYALCKLGIRQGIVGIDLDGLHQIISSTLKPIDTSLLGAPASSHIQMISFEVFRIPFGDTGLLSSHFDLKFHRDFPCNIVLDGKELGKTSVVLLSPDFVTGCGIKQVHVKPQFIGTLPDPSNENGFDAKLASYGQRMVLSIVLVVGASPRNNTQFWNLGETVNDAPRNANG